MWSQWHAELWTVDERRKWTGSKSDSQLADVEMKTNHLCGCRSPPPSLSPLSFPPFPLSPTLSRLPPFLPLSIWFRNCSICHLGVGILPSPATSQTRRPLCCFILYMSPRHSGFLPSHPVLSCTSTLGIVGRRHLLWKVKPPIRFSGGSVGVF